MCRFPVCCWGSCRRLGVARAPDEIKHRRGVGGCSERGGDAVTSSIARAMGFDAGAGAPDRDQDGRPGARVADGCAIRATFHAPGRGPVRQGPAPLAAAQAPIVAHERDRCGRQVAPHAFTPTSSARPTRLDLPWRGALSDAARADDRRTRPKRWRGPDVERVTPSPSVCGRRLRRPDGPNVDHQCPVGSRTGVVVDVCDIPVAKRSTTHRRARGLPHHARVAPTDGRRMPSRRSAPPQPPGPITITAT
jgi:hypothetical protein